PAAGASTRPTPASGTACGTPRRGPGPAAGAPTRTACPTPGGPPTAPTRTPTTTTRTRAGTATPTSTRTPTTPRRAAASPGRGRAGPLARGGGPDRLAREPGRRRPQVVRGLAVHREVEPAALVAGGGPEAHGPLQQGGQQPGDREGEGGHRDRRESLPAEQRK